MFDEELSIKQKAHLIIEEAVKKEASDIHIERYETFCRIRLRQDGLLHEIERPNDELAKRIITFLKMTAKSDISEQRLPQDGQFQIRMNEKTIDIRTSTCPTLYGEKMVLRLLNNNQTRRRIDELGFDSVQKNDFKTAIHAPGGLIIVTGPTGSGKTVTLYSALDALNTPEKNIVTVEDPIEINLTGINQVNILPKAGLNFSQILRAFLRQDPDIIMVGEIRDKETAEIAIKAAQTGHLVLSTLHTNNALESLTRLQQMSVPLPHILSAVKLITAQRLLRSLCPHCKKETIIKMNTHPALSLTKDLKAFKPSGCQHCINGYKGRFAVHEVIPIHYPIKELEDVSFKKMTAKQTYQSLQQKAVQKLSEGITSFEEIFRVIPFNPSGRLLGSSD